MSGDSSVWASDLKQGRQSRLSGIAARTLADLRAGLLALALIAGAGFVLPAPGAEPDVVCGPLFHEATNEFATMKTTQYQHQTQVDRDAGSYRYDCVGFVSYALKRAAPRAWAATAGMTGIPKGHGHSPPRYRAFFSSLAAQPRPGWEAVTNVSDLQPGDVVAWEHKTETSLGHAVIVGSRPARRPDGSWLVEVYDSTSSPHRDDSRTKDPRAQKLASTGRPSGLGHGLMAFIADPATGVLTGYRWSPKAKAVTVPIAAGRPTS